MRRLASARLGVPSGCIPERAAESSGSNCCSTAFLTPCLETSRAGELASQFFRTLDLGAIEAEELGTAFGRVAPLARNVGISIGELNAALATLTIGGVKPATRQLATLQQTLAGLADTVDAIKQFSSSRADIDRLNDTLARASKIADAISALPDQIRQILEQTVDNHGNSADSGGRLMTWLSRKPR